MAAAKFMDAIARANGNSGEDADATGAYTQVVLAEMAEKEKKEFVETWISLPPSQHPDSWKDIENPVCKLRLNLYGHPLAGLYWEKHCEAAIFDAGFEPVKGWELSLIHI